jgi:hypothetical protein
MKVIFLDVDGVLNDWDTPALSKYLWYKESCMKQLQLLVKNTGAKIVVSSTWKYSEELMTKLKNVLEKYGLSVYDVTPDLSDKPPEIRAYLEVHPEVENYVILDDDDFFHEFYTKQVRTLGYLRMGLDEQYRLAAESILNDSEH